MNFCYVSIDLIRQCIFKITTESNCKKNLNLKLKNTLTVLFKFINNKIKKNLNKKY